MAVLKQWPGLFTNYDPHDIPPGGAVVQTNLMSLSPGKLEVRRGYRYLAPSGGQVKSLFHCHTGPGGDSLFIHAGLYVSKYSGGIATYLESGINGKSTFAQTRKGWVVRVNGTQRGSIYDGTTVWKLGMTPPAAAPTIADTYGTGDAYEDCTYWFGYRYRDAAGIYSSLSSLTEVKTTAEHGIFEWTVVAPVETGVAGAVRAQYTELFRSLSDDPTVLYKIATLAAATTSYTNDGASDELLMQCEALPIFFDDGQACARRFTPPPGDRSACVPYQDRYWYAVQEGTDTSTRSLVYWSYPDEPESVPAENAIEVSGDPADPDDITAMFTNTSALYIAKSRHLYRIHYASDPRYNAACRLVASRGVLNQRCMDFHEGTAYFLDQTGPWRLAGNQSDVDFDMPIRNLWSDGTIDYSKAAEFFVAVDSNQAVARFFVMFSTDAGSYPTRALCYGIRSNSWWWETFPLGFSGRARYNVSGRYRTIVGSESSVLVMGEGYSDALYATVQGVENWHGSGITYSYRSGILEIPPADPREPRIPLIYASLIFEPTTGVKADEDVETVSLLLYNDHDATANVWAVTDDATIRGGTAIVVNMLRDQLPLSDNIGCTSFAIQRRSDPKSATHRFLALGLAGSQYGRPHIFYQLGLDGG
jgi:hypothetical protein